MNTLRQTSPFPTLWILIPPVVPYIAACVILLLERGGLVMASHGTTLAGHIAMVLFGVSVVVSTLIGCFALVIGILMICSSSNAQRPVNYASLAFGSIATSGFFLLIL